MRDSGSSGKGSKTEKEGGVGETERGPRVRNHVGEVVETLTKSTKRETDGGSDRKTEKDLGYKVSGFR